MNSCSCFIGNDLQASCQNGRERKFSKIVINDVAIKELELLRIRAKIKKLDNIVDICNHHQHMNEYFKQIKKCVDVFASHKVTVNTTLNEVTLDECKELLLQNI